MISVYTWEKECHAGVWGDAADLEKRAVELRAGPCVTWIDLANPSPEEEERVYKHFLPIHPLTVEDITRLRREPDAPPHFPKVEEFPDYLLVIVNPLSPRMLGITDGTASETQLTDGRAVTQLSAVVTKTVLITHHYEPVVGVKELRAFLERHDTQAGRGPDYLFHIILDATVDQYAPVLDGFDDALDEIEMQVFKEPIAAHLLRLLQLKREIIKARKVLIYEREVLARMARGEFSLIDHREMVYYRNVYDHLVRFTELIESSREMVSDLMQTHLAAVSNKLNEIMKVLTMISTVVLPMTLVAGIYGMNFKNFPELEWRLGYPLALGLMGTMGLASFLFFRWRKWI